MADKSSPQMQATLGLTGLTSNAMALIAPGAFLWLTFYIQANTGSTASTMWLGIVAALLLCLATAVAYAEISKLYPGTGSSYYYAEQALLSKDEFFKYARLGKFIVGWGSHLYYWVYPGVMVATSGMFVGYVVGFLYPNFLSGSNPGPVFMALVAIAFSFFVGWIAQKGVGASTAVNLAINIVQISALMVFSVLAFSQYLLAEALQESGKPVGTTEYKEEVEAATRAVQLDPHLVAAQDLLSAVYLEDGHTEQSILHSRAALALDPNDQQAVYHLIVALRKSDQKDQVPALLKRLLELRTNTKVNEKTSKRFRLYEIPPSTTVPSQ